MSDKFPLNNDAEATRLDENARRSKTRVGTATSFPNPASLAVEASDADLAAISGLNPLVSSATLLLLAVPQIRTTLVHPNPPQLRESLLQQIARFEATAKSRGLAPETVLVARYALCTLIDETVAVTPWGGTADWAKQSLLVTLHRETSGGEKFFQVLNKLAEDPAKNIELLEFFYICLALGFEGRFRVLPNGKAQLDVLRERLAEIIRGIRGEYERDLSNQWRGVQTTARKVSGSLAVWTAGTVLAAGLLGAYLYFDFSLNAKSDELAFGKILAPKPMREPKAIAVASTSEKPASPLLRPFLESEIAAGTVEVLESAQESRVVIRGDGLFDSGSVSVKPAFEPLLGRIAEALKEVSGQVLITGHTDDQPIRSLRFPSNWHLSQQRAETVMRILGETVDRQRLAAEGRADQDALVPNNSPAGRALNRRVEIILRRGAS